MHSRFLAIASLVALSACHHQTNPPGEAPSGVAALAGDGRVTMTWNMEADLTYWIFFQPGSSVSPTSPGALVIVDAVSPHIVNVANGVQYAFVMNATKHDSAAGPSSPIVRATPRLAGAIWDVGAALGTATLNGMAFSGTRFVAVGNSPAAGSAPAVFAGDYNYHYKIDIPPTIANPPGVSEWRPPTPPFPAFTGNLSAVVYAGQFVALAADGSILTSGDGLTWTLAANPVPGTGMNALAFGGGQHVAVGNGGSIFSSADLVTWTQATSGTMNDLFGVSYVGGSFFATGANGTLLKSADGSTWAPPTTIPSTSSALRGVAFRPTGTIRYAAVGDAGTIFASEDAATWTSAAAVTGQNLRSVVHASRFVAVGQGGTVLFSDDGTGWTPASAGSADLSQVIFAPGMYLTVGAAGANAASK